MLDNIEIAQRANLEATDAHNALEAKILEAQLQALRTNYEELGRLNQELLNETTQLKGVCSRLRMESQELSHKNEELSLMVVNLTTKNEELSSKTKGISFDMLEGLVKAEIDSIVSKHLVTLEFEDRVKEAIASAIDRDLDARDIDVSQEVERAITDALDSVTIRFN